MRRIVVIFGALFAGVWLTACATSPAPAPATPRLTEAPTLPPSAEAATATDTPEPQLSYEQQAIEILVKLGVGDSGAKTIIKFWGTNLPDMDIGGVVSDLGLAEWWDSKYHVAARVNQETGGVEAYDVVRGSWLEVASEVPGGWEGDQVPGEIWERYVVANGWGERIEQEGWLWNKRLGTWVKVDEDGRVTHMVGLDIRLYWQ